MNHIELESFQLWHIETSSWVDRLSLYLFSTTPHCCESGPQIAYRSNNFIFSFQSSYLVCPSSRFHATNGKRFFTWKARWWTPGIEQRRGWCSNDKILGRSRETWFLVQCIVVIRFHKRRHISHLPKGTNNKTCSKFQYAYIVNTLIKLNGFR